MRTETDLPWWVQTHLIICGNEGEGGGDGGSGGGGGGGTDDSGTPAGDGAGGDDDGTGDGDDDGDLPDDKDVEGLKSALRKERGNGKKVRELERQLRATQAKVDEAADKDKSELERANKKVEKATGTVTKLATRLRTQAVNSLVERYAREFRFIDVDDALGGIDRKDISVDQDPEDPSDITVDAKTVKAAVKALADRKKHLIKPESDGDDDDEPSGSRFGGKNKDKTKASKAVLEERYPSLR